MIQIFSEYGITCIICYLIGAIPFAYLVVKRRHDFDIRYKGSGNVGAMNSYEVTQSRNTGIIILILDMIKGIFPVFYLLNFTTYNLNQLLLPFILIIFGHNFSIFMKFKGGRGLSTSAGEMLVLCFPLCALWIAIYYVIIKFINQNVHVATVIASVLYPLPVIFFFPLLRKTGFIPAEKMNSFTLEFLFAFCSSCAIIILLKHISPIYELIKNYTYERKSKT